MMEDAVALHRFPEPRGRSAAARRRAIHLEHRVRLRLAAELARDPPAQVRLREPPAARIEEREQAPLVAIAADQRGYARDLAAVERFERRARQGIAIHARLPGHERLPDPELERDELLRAL